MLQLKVEVINLMFQSFSKMNTLRIVPSLADPENLVQNKKKLSLSSLSVIGTPERKPLLNLDTNVIYLPLQSSEFLNGIRSRS